MNKNKLFLAGMLVLVFALVVVGCDTGTNPAESVNTDPKTLVITGIEDTLATQFQDDAMIGIFPVGTTLEQALLWTGIVAGAKADDEALSPGPAPYTVTVELLAVEDGKGTSDRWTGSGTYDIYLLPFSGGSIYLKQNVSFTSASTSVSIADFSTESSSDYDGTWNGSDGSYFVISGASYEFTVNSDVGTTWENGHYFVSGDTITFYPRGWNDSGSSVPPSGQFTTIGKEWENTGTLAVGGGSFTMQVTVTTRQFQDGQFSGSSQSSETVTFTVTDAPH